jgi:5-methylcytosine-specific restriction endonuclease McrA
MPNKPPTHERRLARTGRRHVDGHSQDGTTDPVVRAIRNSARYKRFIAIARRRAPLCCDPFGYHAKDGITQPTHQIHHIIGLALDAGLAYDLSNCVGLCTRCHAMIEQRVRAGERTAYMFDGKAISCTMR